MDDVTYASIQATNKKATDNLKKGYIMFDEEVIKNLKIIKETLKDIKTRFDHVRGNVENKEIMCDALDRAIEIIEDKDFGNIRE